MSGKPEIDDQKMLCYCLGVRHHRVVEVIRDNDCKTVAEVTRLCRAGGGCRSCHPEIEDEIQKHREQKGRGLFAFLRKLLLRKSS